MKVQLPRDLPDLAIRLDLAPPGRSQLRHADHDDAHASADSTQCRTEQNSAEQAVQAEQAVALAVEDTRPVYTYT